jgi:hypothetical protein
MKHCARIPGFLTATTWASAQIGALSLLQQLRPRSDSPSGVGPGFLYKVMEPLNSFPPLFSGSAPEVAS